MVGEDLARQCKASDVGALVAVGDAKFEKAGCSKFAH